MGTKTQFEKIRFASSTHYVFKREDVARMLRDREAGEKGEKRQLPRQRWERNDAIAAELLRAQPFLERLDAMTADEALALSTDGLTDLELAELAARLDDAAEEIADEDEARAEVFGERSLEILRATAVSPEGSAALDYADIFAHVALKTSDRGAPMSRELVVRALAEELRNRGGRNWRAYIHDLADVCTDEGDPSAGVRLYALCLRQDPGLVIAYLHAAAFLADLGRRERALATLSRGREVLGQLEASKEDEKLYLELLTDTAERVRETEAPSPAPELDEGALAELDAALVLSPGEGARLPIDILCRLAIPDIDAVPAKRLPGKSDAAYAARIPEIPYHCTILHTLAEMDDADICEKVLRCGLEVPKGLPEEIVSRGARMVPLLGAVLLDPDFGDRDDLGDWGVIHALHLLGAMGAPEGAAYVIDWLRTEPETDFATESVPSVLGRMGEGAIDATAAFVADTKADDILRGTAARGLVAIGRRFPEARPRAAEEAARLLREAITARDLKSEGVTWMVSAFDAIPDAEVQESIDAAFGAGLVYQGIIDREDVERVRASDAPWSFHAPDDEPMEYFSARNLARLRKIEGGSDAFMSGGVPHAANAKKQNAAQKKKKDKRKQAKKSRRKGRR